MKHFLCITLALLLFSHCLQADTVDSVRKTLVDKNATPETAALFYNLQKIAAEGKTLIGQQDPDRTATRRRESTDIQWITGKELAVWGHDFMDISKGTLPDAPNREEVRRAAERQAARSLDLTINAYDEGIVNVFCWHLRNPEQQSFYARELPDDRKDKMFRGLLPGGNDHEWYKERLREVADFAKKAKGKNGTLSPIIFRPFHEFDGDWFWWGKPYCTPQEYINCWRFTVEYLRDELGVRNFLYAFSPDNRFNSEAEFLERYPGNDYVDMVGFDNYSDFENNRIEAAARKLKIISDYAVQHGKLAALTEVGYRNRPIPPDLYTGYYGRAFADPSLHIAFFMFWRQGNPPTYVPTPDSPLKDNFLEFMNSPRMVLLPDIGNVYSFDQKSTITRSASEVRDKIRGGLIGQIFANLNGLQYENKHLKEPGNVTHYTPSLPEGAETDDDTDIEWVYIVAMQKYGLFVPYDKLSEAWKASINSYIWCSHRYVRYLLDFGISPEYTGLVEVNPWAEFNIAGQFVSEMFALISPHMPQSASRLGTYYTRIAVDEEPLQTTQLFDTMIALAFETDDLTTLLDAGQKAVDPESNVAEVIRNVRSWCAQYPDDWKETRKLIHSTYTKQDNGMRDFNGYELNTAATLAALIYGQGDYVQTAIHAFNFGWDADNTAAAAGTIIGVMRGAEWFKQQGWEIKDVYKNTRRDNMPMDETLTSYGNRLIELAEKQIIASGGRVDENVYEIPVEHPANILPLTALRAKKKATFEHLKEEVIQAFESNPSDLTPSGIAYLAICLDLAPELEAKDQIRWRNLLASLQSEKAFLTYLYEGEKSVVPTLEAQKTKLRAAGIQYPVPERHAAINP